MSRRSCLSISALIRFDSFASSLRQQAIMDSRVIPSALGSPAHTEPGNACPRSRLLPQKNPRRSLRSPAEEGLCRGGRMDGRDWGGGETSLGASPSSCPPGRERLRLRPGVLGKSREIHTGGGSQETVGPPRDAALMSKMTAAD